MVINLLPQRLKMRVAEEWTNLVLQVAAHRGITLSNSSDVDRFGHMLWYEEWVPWVDSEEYADEIRARQEALRRLMTSHLPAEEFADAIEVVVAPLPPHLFQLQVLDPLIEQGWTRVFPANAGFSTDIEILVPDCYAHLVWESPETSAAHESGPF